jgi:hypothetical protein
LPPLRRRTTVEVGRPLLGHRLGEERERIGPEMAQAKKGRKKNSFLVLKLRYLSLIIRKPFRIQLRLEITKNI